MHKRNRARGIDIESIQPEIEPKRQSQRGGCQRASARARNRIRAPEPEGSVKEPEPEIESERQSPK